MACDASCGTMYSQGSAGCGGGMMAPQGMGYQGNMSCSTGCGAGGGMGYPGAGWGPGGGFGQYQPLPPGMGYQQAQMMDYQQGQCQGCQSGPFDKGSGCGGLNVVCEPQGADIPKQARARKPRPPSSTVPKRKVGTSYTTLVTPLAGAKELAEEEKKDLPPDHERFDTLTLAFGTKPGTDKPPKILLTLKSPKVIDAKLSTSTAATQVHYRDLGLPDPNAKPEDTKSRASKMSRKSKQSKKSAKTSKSKGSKKASKGKKGKK